MNRVSMPISSMPMPSDDVSQQQVLLELKSELTVKAQHIQDSPMNSREKRHAMEHVRNEISCTERQIDSRQDRQAVKQRQEQKELAKKQIEHARLGKQMLRAEDEKAKDIHEQNQKQSLLDIQV